MKIRFLFMLFGVIVLLSYSTAVARPGSPEFTAAVGTAVTFQGQLLDGGNPATGQYDLSFGLYDAANAGNLIGTDNQDDVVVDNGLFTVQLDFGAVFTGTAYWLEIGVRPGSSTGGYTTLSPRQALTAAPYALYSTAAPWSGLSGVPAGFADGVDNDTTYTAGTGLTLGSGAFSVSFGGSGSAITAAHSDHNHLGQTWSGSDNPLIVNGAYAGSTSTSGAPLILTNTGGDGLRIQQAGTPPGSSNDANSNGIEIAGAQSRGLYVGRSGDDGVYIAQTGAPVGGSVTSATPNGFEIARAEGHGVFVGNADDDGVRVYQAGKDGVNVRAATVNGMLIEQVGTPSATNTSSAADGVEIQGAQGNGLFIGQADADGVHVRRVGTPVNTGSTNASANGVEVVSAQGYGIYISRSDLDGIRIGLAGDDGIDVAGNDLAGYFAGSISVGSCTGCLLMTFAVNVSDRPLQPGDIVTVRGMAAGAFDNAANLLQVAPASAGLPIVGVVASRAEVDVKQEPREGESGVRLVPRDGAAAAGDYVSVVYNGPVQVKAAGQFAVGDKLTVNDSGNLRRLSSTKVNGILLTEDAPVLGIALSLLENDLIWVLVNPQ
jgi:hypothetical protein